MTAVQDVHDVAAAAHYCDANDNNNNDEHSTALVTTTTTTATTDGDARAFMQVLLYGKTAGWGGRAGAADAELCVGAVGYKGLLEQVLRARHCHKNDDNKSASGDEVQALIDETRAAYLAAEQQLFGDTTRTHRDDNDDATAEEADGGDGEATAVAVVRGGNGLLHCPDWMALRDRFFDAGAILATAGHVDDAARCFLHATFVSRALCADDEAHTTLSLSVEQLTHTHPRLAADALVRLASCCDARGLRWQAARCRSEAAELHERALDDKPGAVALYRAAMATYDTTQLYGMHASLRDACLQRLCYLHVAMHDYVEAEALLLAKARATSARRLPATRFYLYATLCRLARGYYDENDNDNDNNNNNNESDRNGHDDTTTRHDHASRKRDKGSEAFFDALYDTRKLFLALQDEDSGYQSGKENALMRSLLAACDAGALRDVDVAVMQYKAYKTTVPSVIFDMLCERCRNNVYEHIERFA